MDTGIDGWVPPAVSMLVPVTPAPVEGAPSGVPLGGGVKKEEEGCLGARHEAAGPASDSADSKGGKKEGGNEAGGVGLVGYGSESDEGSDGDGSEDSGGGVGKAGAEGKCDLKLF